MTDHSRLGLLSHFTYKGNLKNTRYGWLRLTPAYSIHLVSEILNVRQGSNPVILDPFCGTGTTALLCAENSLPAITTDINPFLIWLTRTKTQSYTVEDIDTFRTASATVLHAIRAADEQATWIPPLFQIEKWWNEPTLKALSHAMSVIHIAEKTLPEPSVNLLKVVFSRVMIDLSNASFRHQSMSFKKDNPVTHEPIPAPARVTEAWQIATDMVALSAQTPIGQEPKVLLCDARNLSSRIGEGEVSCVITSPPYPNRMSYIRELRPYMYWLGFLQDARGAAELDWEAIGGTWGSATSKVGKWKPDKNIEIPYDGFYKILDNIGSTSDLLSRYVHKYFYDMVHHVKDLYKVMRHDGKIYYVVGNSRFYGVLLPVEEIFAELFRNAGFADITVTTIRKRTSKAELYEFLVSATKK
jgi:hypothetical protein